MAPSARRSARSRPSSRRERETQQNVVEEDADEESNQEPIVLTIKRNPRSNKKSSKAASARKQPQRARRRRSQSESSDEPEHVSDDEDSSSNSESEEEDRDEAEQSEEEFEDIGEEDPKKRTYIPRDRDPVYIQERTFDRLVLPDSSEDLLVPGELILQAIGIYEILRRFSQSLQLTPFRLEDFCCAVVAEENSRLVCEIFSSMIRLMVRESEHAYSWLAPHDEKDSVYLAAACLDTLTWPELMRCFLQSSPEYKDGLRIAEQSNFPCVSAKDKLALMEILCGVVLRLPGVIRNALSADTIIHHEETCRNCQKPGDLICCETCPATYHLECASPPLKEVPEGEWFCAVCRLNQVSSCMPDGEHGVTSSHLDTSQVQGVSDCVTEVEKLNYSLRHEPLGLDRHGRRFAFMTRRLFVYEEDESSCWYYSTVTQFEELVSLLDSDDLEKELCEALRDLDAEIRRHMDTTTKIAKKLGSNRSSYFDKVDYSIRERRRLNGEDIKIPFEDLKESPSVRVELKTEEPEMDGNASEEFRDDDSPGPRVATRTSTGALAAKTYAEANRPVSAAPKIPVLFSSDPNNFDLNKVSGGIHKLGIEGTFRQYRNIYLENQFAQNRQQKQEERDRRRHLGVKFHLGGEKNVPNGEFRWLGTTSGLCKSMVVTIRNTLLDLSKQIHPAFFHPHWTKYRPEWEKLVTAAEKPEELALALTRFEACCKPAIFAQAWHESLGCIRWGKYAVMDRDEARSRRRDEEEIASRSAKKAYVNFVQGVQHQIWKHKGEEFRLSGKGGVFWWSWRYFEEEDEKPPLRNSAKSPEKLDTEDDVIDISASLRSGDSKFYPVEDALANHLRTSVDNLDRLMAIVPNAPPVAPPAAPAETKKEDTKDQENAEAIKKVVEENPEVVKRNVQDTLEVLDEKSEGLKKAFLEKPEMIKKVVQDNSEGVKKAFPENPEIVKKVVLDSKMSNGQASKEEKEKLVNGLSDDADDKMEVDIKPVEKTDEASSKKSDVPITAGIVDLNKAFPVTYKAALPGTMKDMKDEDLVDFYRISEADYFILSVNSGISEVPGFKYDYKSAPHWEYPHFPRPNIRTIWRFRTYAIKNLGGVAMQMRILWTALKWDDIQIKPTIDGVKAVQDESGVTHNLIMKKRSFARYSDFPRFEYLIKRTVLPFKDGNTKNTQKSTPGREGLRERKIESPRTKTAYTVETWVDESEVELWEIRSFYDRVEHPPEIPKMINKLITPTRPLATGMTTRALVSTPLGGAGGVHAGSRMTGFSLVKSTGLQQYAGRTVMCTGTGADGKPQYVLIPEKGNFAHGTFVDGSPLFVSTAGRNSTIYRTAAQPIAATQLNQEETYDEMAEEEEQFDEMNFLEDEPASEEARTLTDEEVVKMVASMSASGNFSQDTLNKLYKDRGSVPANRGGIKRAKEPPAELDPTDLILQDSLDRITKRVAQLKKIGNSRLLHMRNHAKRAQMSAHAIALQNLVNEYPYLIPGLPHRPQSSLLLSPKPKEAKLSKYEYRGRPRGRPPGRALSKTPLSPEDVIAPKPVPVTPTSPVKVEPPAPPLDPNAIPPLRIKKKLLNPSPDEPKVTKAKMISTAPKIDETALVEKIPKKRGRKSNAQKQEEMEAAALLAQQQAEAAASAAAAEAAARPPPPPPPEPEEPNLRIDESTSEDSRRDKKKKKKKRSREEKRDSPKKDHKHRHEVPADHAEEKAHKKKHNRIEELNVQPAARPEKVEATPVSGKGRKRKDSSGEKVSVQLGSSSPKRKRPKKAVSDEYEEKEGELHCSCRQPYDNNRFYIGCDNCDVWYHGDCVGVKEGDVPPDQKWFCPDCRRKLAPPPQVPPVILILPPKKRKASYDHHLDNQKPKPEPPSLSVSNPALALPKLKFKMGSEDLFPATSVASVPHVPEQNLPPIKLKLKKAKVAPNRRPSKSSGPSQTVLEEAVKEPPGAVSVNTVQTVQPKQNGVGNVVREPGKQTQGICYCFCRELYDPTKGYRKFIKCDRCREWYHPRCVGLTTSRADSLRNFVCSACQNRPQTRDFLYRQLRQEDYRVLNSVVDELRKHRNAWPFILPVDPAEANDYYTVITEPMDLTTMSRQLQAQHYKTMGQFLYDVGLIFDNARTYNKEETVYYRAADQLEEFFMGRMNKIKLGQ